MKTKYKFFVLVSGILVSGLILTGCGPSHQNPTSTSSLMTTTEIPNINPNTPTVLLTSTFTPTYSSTPSITPTITNTPTNTPSPTPNMVMPGNYYIGKCLDYPGQYSTTVRFCVTGVRVDSERHMFFDVSWKIFKLPSDVTVVKKSDSGNQRMYLTDNLGNHYEHLDGGGAAYRDVLMYNADPNNAQDPGVTGWFKFRSPPVGALKFDFHDDDNHIVIKDIVLIPGYGFIKYDTLMLDQYLLSIEYDKDKWDPTKADDGTNMLTHKTMPSCTIQPRLPSEPNGKYKSLTTVGDIDYKIYGYYDEGQKLFIREYVYESGLKKLDPEIKPFFFVTIPEDKTLECIVAVNNVLGRLAIPNQ